jgi:hypothetical protein
MPVDITAISLTDEYTGTSVAGTDFLMGSIFDKLTQRIDIAVHWESLNVKLTADVAAKTFTRFDNVKWRNLEFRINDTIEIANFGANNATYTITAITDNVISVDPAPANNATDNNVHVYGTTTITNLDFYFNLIKNSDSESYISTVDRETVQKYGNTGVLNASAGAGSVNLIAETKSFGWLNGSGTITNSGITNRQQKFRIEHTFKISPYFLNSQLESTEEGLYPPDYFADNECLKYICKIDARPIKYDPEVVHSSTNGTGAANTFKIGNDGWLNEFLNGKAPNYTLTSIAYEDNATALPLDRIDFNKSTKVTIVLGSVNNVFVNTGGGYATGSPMVIGFSYLPLTESRYVNTQRTMDQNFLIDRVVSYIGAAQSDGEQFGTDYQVIVDCDITYVSASSCTITFDVEFSAATKTLLESVDENDRNYLLWVTPQIYSATKLIQTDRTAVACDVQNCDWNRDDATQFEILTTNVDFYEFPSTTTSPTTDVKAWCTDTVISKHQFLIPNNSKLISHKIIIRAYNATLDESFELESYSFNFTGLYGDNNTITQSIVNDKGYKLSDNDERNIILFERVSAIDTLTQQGYQVDYPFKLRYEHWRRLQQFNKAFVASPVQDWSIYSSMIGWQIQFVIQANVYDAVADYTTPFEHTANITVKDQNTSNDGSGNSIAIALSTGSLGSNLGGILLLDEDTLVTLTFTGTGDFTTLPAGKTGWYGILYLDIENTGGENFVDENNTTQSVRSDSMWATQAVLTVFNSTTILLSASIDYEKMDKQNARYLIYGKIGFTS